MYEHEGYSSEHYSHPKTNIEYMIDGESSITEVCESFENFLLATGFRLNLGEKIGVLNND